MEFSVRPNVSQFILIPFEWSVGSDQDPNYLQRLSADDKICLWLKRVKSKIMNRSSHAPKHRLVHYDWAATWDFQQCGMCNQQRLRPACDRSEPLLVAWIFYECLSTDRTSFGVFLSEKEAAQARLNLHWSKYHIVWTHMSRLNCMSSNSNANDQGTMHLTYWKYADKRRYRRSDQFVWHKRAI